MSSFVPHVPRSVKNLFFLVDYAVCSGAYWKLAPACDECHDWSISVKNFALSSLLIFTPVHDCVKELVYSFLYPSAPAFFFFPFLRGWEIPILGLFCSAVVIVRTFKTAWFFVSYKSPASCYPWIGFPTSTSLVNNSCTNAGNLEA